MHACTAYSKTLARNPPATAPQNPTDQPGDRPLAPPTSAAFSTQRTRNSRHLCETHALQQNLYSRAPARSSRCGIVSGEAEAEALDRARSVCLGIRRTQYGWRESPVGRGVRGVPVYIPVAHMEQRYIGAVQKTDAQTERNHGRTKPGGVGVEPGVTTTVLTQR